MNKFKKNSIIIANQYIEYYLKYKSFVTIYILSHLIHLCVIIFIEILKKNLTDPKRLLTTTLFGSLHLASTVFVDLLLPSELP